MKSKGFTLIELLVVIAIIGILSTVILSSLSSSRERARDAKRKADLNTIRTALTMYYLDYGNYPQESDGCGRTGDGGAYFNYSGTNWGYLGRSIADCLYEGGYTGSEIIDPTGNDGVTTGGRPTSSNNLHAYMIARCIQDNNLVVYLYAKMETEPQSSSATNDTCVATWDSGYGMNYWVKID